MYIFLKHKVERRHGTESPACSSCSSSSSSSSSSISSCRRRRRRRRRGCRPHTQCLLSVLRDFLHSGAVVTFLSCCLFISYLPTGNDTDANARQGTARHSKHSERREREEPACPAVAAAAANVVVGRRSLHLGSLIVQCVYVLYTHTHRVRVCGGRQPKK